MLSDYDIALLLQAQYDGTLQCDFQSRIGVVSVAVKHYPDFTLILNEGTFCAPDWASNFKTLMVPLKNGGRVDWAFQESIPESIDALEPYLQPDKPALIGGHSRGASHTNTMALELINRGWKRENIRRVAIAPARCFDAAGVAALAGCAGTAYRNCHDVFDQDFVCDVPLHFLGEPYEITDPWITIDVPAKPDDPWLLFKRHHLFLYTPHLQGAPIG